MSEGLVRMNLIIVRSSIDYVCSHNCTRRTDGNNGGD